MKIALISNMNNNYFALLRYLRNMGEEVILFHFEDEYAHFNPENDTWHLEQWQPYIKKLPFKYYDHYNQINSFDEEAVKSELKDFDILIGSGPSPAYLDKVGIHLDAFFPYKTGIEYYKDITSIRYPALSKKIRGFNELQKAALRKTPYAINRDFRSETYERIKSLGMINKPLTIPMVYLEQIPTTVELPKVYLDGIRKMLASDFIICHLGRHLWKRRWTQWAKGFNFINNNANDKVIKAFHALIQNRNAKDALLVLFEYGPQVDLSKNLIKRLGIENQVLWFPLTPRKIIMQLIPYFTLGIGDIAVGAWGGKAMEFIANGVPIINSISKENKNLYELHVNHSVPPFIRIQKAEEIKDSLDYYYVNKTELSLIAKNSLQWFEEYDGLALAKGVLNFCNQRLAEKKEIYA